MARLVKVVNLEAGMPSVDEARRRLQDELRKARAEGWQAVKFIHGWGSTGVGGKLKDELRKSLARRRNDGEIRCFVYGEKWTIFESAAQEVLAVCPDLRRDSDLENFNKGITLVIL